MSNMTDITIKNALAITNNCFHMLCNIEIIKSTGKVKSTAKKNERPPKRVERFVRCRPLATCERSWKTGGWSKNGDTSFIMPGKKKSWTQHRHGMERLYDGSGLRTPTRCRGTEPVLCNACITANKVFSDAGRKLNNIEGEQGKTVYRIHGYINFGVALEGWQHVCRRQKHRKNGKLSFFSVTTTRMEGRLTIDVTNPFVQRS